MRQRGLDPVRPKDTTLASAESIERHLAFRDKAGRDHYPASPQSLDDLTSSNGVLESFEAIGDILRSLLDPKEIVAE